MQPHNRKADRRRAIDGMPCVRQTFLGEPHVKKSLLCKTQPDGSENRFAKEPFVLRDGTVIHALDGANEIPLAGKAFEAVGVSL